MQVLVSLNYTYFLKHKYIMPQQDRIPNPAKSAFQPDKPNRYFGNADIIQVMQEWPNFKYFQG